MKSAATSRAAALALLLAFASACGSEEPARDRPPAGKTTAPAVPAKPAAQPVVRPEPPAPAAPAEPAEGWRISTGEDGIALSLAGPGGDQVSLSCPAGGGQLVVNLRRVAPIGSEERMSIGAGGTVVALVADTAGDIRRGGVTATGPVPAELAAILADAGGLSVAYGARTSGPHPPVPAALASRFVSACAR